MDKIITQCSHCNAKFKLGSEKVGKKIRCPKCKGVFVVQEVAAKAKPVPEPAPPQVAPPPKPEEPKVAPAPPPVAETPPPAPVVEEVVPLKERPRPLQVKDFFETQHMRFIAEKAEGVNAHISYNITGDAGGQWTVIIRNGELEVNEGADPAAKSHVKMTSKSYLKIAMGKLDSRVAFMLGKLKIKGDKASLASVRQCFKVPDVK